MSDEKCKCWTEPGTAECPVCSNLGSPSELSVRTGSAPHVWKCFHCDFQTTDMNIICNHEKEAHPNEYADSLYREVFGPWE